MNSSHPMAVPATAHRTPVKPFRGQSRSRLFRADLLTVLARASAALAVALWLADGGAAGFATLAGSFTTLGIVAGLAGMDLVLLMLLLAARLPVIAGAVGHDRALEFHRQLGKPSLHLLLAHGILIAMGYGVAEGLDPVSELVALWVLVPDMWLAIVSAGLYIAVVATSLVAARRRFPYELCGPSWLPESAVRSGHRLASYAPDDADADVYICGPSAWARSVSGEARAAGVREEQIHNERFDW